MNNPTKTYMCVVCGFVYDEAAGRPGDGLPAGTRWADVPDSWNCPECGAAKADFELVEI
jgi:rubredoxin